MNFFSFISMLSKSSLMESKQQDIPQSNLTKIFKQTISFLEFTHDATKWLIEKRKIVGIGTECPDIELSQKGQVKILLAKHGLYSVVQMANLKSLPERGFNILVAPLKLRHGSGGPTRIYAILNHHRNHHRTNHETNRDDICKDYIKVRRQEQQVFYSSAIVFRLSTFTCFISYVMTIYLT